MSGMGCTQYVLEAEYRRYELCRCPNCAGWLPRKFPLNEPFKCKKCGATLMTFPDRNPETGEEWNSGKICMIKEARE